MASRQEEKERRRQERLEREAAERRARERKARVRLVGGGVLGLAVVAAVVFALVSVLGGGDAEGGGRPVGARGAVPALPAQRITDLREAAAAANCEVVNARYEGNGHDANKDFQASDYRTNPPTSGAHDPEWYDDGIYASGDLPELGKVVHTLEHGRIDVQYRPGTSARSVSQLEGLLQESNDGYHMLLFENTTEMPYAVAATAWTQMLGCRRMNDRVFDAIRAFRTRYIDKGPETVP